MDTGPATKKKEGKTGKWTNAVARGRRIKEQKKRRMNIIDDIFFEIVLGLVFRLGNFRCIVIANKAGPMLWYVSWLRVGSWKV